jgi:hypothetical protein
LVFTAVSLIEAWQASIEQDLSSVTPPHGSCQTQTFFSTAALARFIETDVFVHRILSCLVISFKASGYFAGKVHS